MNSGSPIRAICQRGAECAGRSNADSYAAGFDIDATFDTAMTRDYNYRD
jgi:hypothetical protein